MAVAVDLPAMAAMVKHWNRVQMKKKLKKIVGLYLKIFAVLELQSQSSQKKRITQYIYWQAPFWSGPIKQRAHEPNPNPVILTFWLWLTFRPRKNGVKPTRVGSFEERGDDCTLCVSSCPLWREPFEERQRGGNSVIGIALLGKDRRQQVGTHD